MGRIIDDPDVEDIGRCLPIEQGGTIADTVKEAVANLHLLTYNHIGIPRGAIELDSNGQVPRKYLLAVESGVNVDGPTFMVVDQISVLKITDYDQTIEYTITPILGQVSRIGEDIYYSSGSVVGNGGFVLNGRTIHIPILSRQPLPPTITSPVTNAVNIKRKTMIVSSVFQSPPTVTDMHHASSWQLATDSNFNNIVQQSLNDTVNLTAWTVSLLTQNTQYYVRVKHIGTLYSESQWSNVVTFHTLAVFLAYNEIDMIISSEPVSLAYFGYSQQGSLDLSRLAITDHMSTSKDLKIYDRQNDDWIKTHTFTPDSGQTFAFNQTLFLHDISDNGQRVVFYSRQTSSPYLHYVKIKDFVNNTWIDQGSITLSDPNASYSRVGLCLSGDGNTIFFISEIGNIYIYILQNSTWVLQANLTSILNEPGLPIKNPRISKDGNRIAFEIFRSSPSIQSQTVVLARTNNIWALEYKSGYALTTYLGFDMSQNGDTISAFVSNSHGVYVYRRIGTIWSLSEIISLALLNVPSSGHGVIDSCSISPDGTAIALSKAYNNGNFNNVVFLHYFNNTWAYKTIIGKTNTSGNDAGFGFNALFNEDATLTCVNSVEYEAPYGHQGACFVYELDLTL